MSGNVSEGESSASDQRAAASLKLRQLGEERAADKRLGATVHKFNLRQPIKDFNFARKSTGGAA